MAIRSLTHSLAVLVLAAIPALANAAPAPFDGRFYEVVIVSGITWDAANADANSRTCGLTCPAAQRNLQGHLATINTLAENNFIQTLNQPPGNRTELWIGGLQQSGSTEPGGGWKWVNGETIPVPNPTGSGFGWLPGEPSNGPGGAEQHLTFGRDGLPGWNDNDKTSNIYGYVVEYGDKFSPFTWDTCASGGPGCNLGGGLFAGTVNGTVIKVPLNQTQIPDASKLLISTELHKNDAARCGVSTLILFNGEVVVPKYLCGDPDLLVAHVETIGDAFDINQGVVDILNGNDVLTGTLHDCQPSGIDPTEAEVVGYQSSVRALEKEFTTGIDDILVGTVGEFTNACGSSRGSGPTRSWYFAGLRIYPGALNDAVTNLSGNIAFRYTLLKYKLDVLALAVSKACDNDGPKAYANGVCSSLDSQVKVLKGDIANGNATEARAHAKNFAKTLTGAKLTIIPGENNDGELRSRFNNFTFTLNKFFP